MAISTVPLVARLPTRHSVPNNGWQRVQFRIGRDVARRRGERGWSQRDEQAERDENGGWSASARWRSKPSESRCAKAR
jgi:hypothetical protein